MQKYENTVLHHLDSGLNRMGANGPQISHAHNYIDVNRPFNPYANANTNRGHFGTEHMNYHLPIVHNHLANHAHAQGHAYIPAQTHTPEKSYLPEYVYFPNRGHLPYHSHLPIIHNLPNYPHISGYGHFPDRYHLPNYAYLPNHAYLPKYAHSHGDLIHSHANGLLAHVHDELNSKDHLDTDAGLIEFRRDDATAYVTAPDRSEKAVARHAAGDISTPTADREDYVAERRITTILHHELYGDSDDDSQPETDDSPTARQALDLREINLTTSKKESSESSRIKSEAFLLKSDIEYSDLGHTRTTPTSLVFESLARDIETKNANINDIKTLGEKIAESEFTDYSDNVYHGAFEGNYEYFI